jgi:hypothetical protein
MLVASFGQTGFGSGDGVVITFDQKVSIVDLSATVSDSDAQRLCGVRRLVRFSPDLPTLTTCDARWLDTTRLHTVFPFVPPSDVWAASMFRLGEVNVSMLASGGLLSLSRESTPSTSSATVSVGSWGDEPVAALLERTPSSIRVVLRPPADAYAIAPSKFIVHWSDDPVADFGSAWVLTNTPWNEVIMAAVDSANSAAATVVASSDAGAATVFTFNVSTGHSGFAAVVRIRACWLFSVLRFSCVIM